MRRKSDLELFMDGLTTNKHAREIEKHVLKNKFKRIRKNGMTIYKQNRKSNTAVVFLSGGVVLQFTPYLQKLIDDLHIRDRDILVFENKTAFNLTCMKQITRYLQKSDYNNVTIIGCSMGGVIGSHVLAGLNKQKRLICIDTPFRPNESIKEAFEQHFVIWRPDIYSLYQSAIRLAEGSYNYTDVFKITSIRQYQQYLFDHFGMTANDHDFYSSMNPNINNGEIISFYNEEDPVCIRHISIQTVERYKRILDKTSSFKEVRIRYNGAGHCTEWISEATKSEATKSEATKSEATKSEATKSEFVRQLRKII
jgi:hypothetical protein